MINSGKGYVGKISNGASQNVQAPNQSKPSGGKSTVKRGGDLRSKGSSGGSKK